MYDLIGDIHGYADPLRRLLAKLGYEERDGVWQHPERQVIFLGDFVDRGPEQVETVMIARRMVETGKALAVMGNHEFNAIAWATPDSQNPGQYLRPHTDKNRGQHAAFLEQVGENSQQHQDMIRWFKTLPLYLDLEGIRVIHACWHSEHLNTLAGYTDSENRILESAWPELTSKGTDAYEALETVLKGLEIPLPSGIEFRDKDNNVRRNVRLKWWDQDGVTYRDLANLPPEIIDTIPHEPIPQELIPSYDGDKPLFVGHYWLTGHPAPLNDHIACLDYSVASPYGAGKDHRGKLCAYRWRAGETLLKDSNFEWVPSSS